MMPTFIGGLLLLVGLPIMLYGRVEAMIALLLGCTIFGGASAIDLPALGGSSIPPIDMALVLAALRIFVPGSRQARPARAAIAASLPLLLFAAWGAAVAIIGPRLFRGTIDLPPMRFRTIGYIYATVPLAPSAQNLTTTVYLTGTALCAIVMHVMCAGTRGPRALVKVAVAVAWINVALGIVVAATRDTPLQACFDLFRNGSYAQLDQSFGGFIRLSGLFPEPSAYATYCFGWFCFMAECWYRDMLPRRTGPAAFALGAILLASTSSTAYISLGAYGVILAARMLVPGAVRSAKLLVILLALLAGAMIAGLMVLLLPAAGAAFVDMITYMTVGKSDSFSGLQRAFWARKGVEAFVRSHGIGVGPGSFRSSSLATAILGSTGAIGLLLFVTHVLRVLKPLRATTYLPRLDERTATGAAAGWAALMLLVPYSVVLASCDPGADFAIFSGAALALRAAAFGRRGTAGGGAGGGAGVNAGSDPPPAGGWLTIARNGVTLP